MTAAAPRASRGAATVELILGTLVLIPVILYGIHFTELGIASMKVFEAASSPVWEATAYPMHIMGVGPSHEAFLDNAINESSTSAAIRYGLTFDGHIKGAQQAMADTLAAGAAPLPFVELFTVAGDLSVQCKRATASVGPELGYSPLFVGLVIPDTHGLACSAEAKALNMMPRSFMNVVNGGFFQESLNESAGRFTRLCAIGRPDGLQGPCRGSFAMLLDDWGLASAEFPGFGSSEADACTITLGVPGTSLPCENRSYYLVARSLYEIHTLPFALMRAPHRALVAATVGGNPSLMSSDTSFYMSFRGEETFFHTFTPTSDINDFGFKPNDHMFWQTTPFSSPPQTYFWSYAIRKKCYLGLDGC